MFVDIHNLKGFHERPVGLECSSTVWNSLTNAPIGIAVNLKSTATNSSEVLTVKPGQIGTVCDRMPNVHYLFGLTAQGDITVQITFPNPPADNSAIKLIVYKTPEETGN